MSQRIDWQDMPQDIFVHGIAKFLDAESIARLQSTSHTNKQIFSKEEVWKHFVHYNWTAYPNKWEGESYCAYYQRISKEYKKTVLDRGIKGVPLYQKIKSALELGLENKARRLMESARGVHKKKNYDSLEEKNELYMHASRLKVLIKIIKSKKQNPSINQFIFELIDCLYFGKKEDVWGFSKDDFIIYWMMYGGESQLNPYIEKSANSFIDNEKAIQSFFQVLSLNEIFDRYRKRDKTQTHQLTLEELRIYLLIKCSVLNDKKILNYILTDDLTGEQKNNVIKAALLTVLLQHNIYSNIYLYLKSLFALLPDEEKDAFYQMVIAEKAGEAEKLLAALPVRWSPRIKFDEPFKNINKYLLNEILKGSQSNELEVEMQAEKLVIASQDILYNLIVKKSPKEKFAIFFEGLSDELVISTLVDLFIRYERDFDEKDFSETVGMLRLHFPSLPWQLAFKQAFVRQGVRMPEGVRVYIPSKKGNFELLMLREIYSQAINDWPNIDDVSCFMIDDSRQSSKVGLEKALVFWDECLRANKHELFIGHAKKYVADWGVFKEKQLKWLAETKDDFRWVHQIKERKNIFLINTDNLINEIIKYDEVNHTHVLQAFLDHSLIDVKQLVSFIAKASASSRVYEKRLVSLVEELRVLNSLNLSQLPFPYIESRFFSVLAKATFLSDEVLRNPDLLKKRVEDLSKDQHSETLRLLSQSMLEEILRFSRNESNKGNHEIALGLLNGALPLFGEHKTVAGEVGSQVANTVASWVGFFANDNVVRIWQPTLRQKKILALIDEVKNKMSPPQPF